MKKLILFFSLAIAAFGQAQPVVRRVICNDAGANDTYTCTALPTLGSYTNGLEVRLTVNTANTGAATLNIDSLGAKAIVKLPGGVSTTLADNDLVPNGTYTAVYNATNDNFKITSATGSVPSGGSGGISEIDRQWQQSNITLTGVGNDITAFTTSNVSLSAGACLYGSVNVLHVTGAGTNGVIYKLKLGGTTIYSRGSTSTAGPFIWDFRICNDPGVQNAQHFSLDRETVGGSVTIYAASHQTTPSVDWSSPLTITVTAAGVSSDTVTPYYWNLRK